MKIRHEWSELHGNIINALIRVLQAKKFEISPNTVFAVQSILQKRGVSFFDAWDDISALYRETSWSYPFWQIALCQGASAVFYKMSNSYSENKDEFDFFKKRFFGHRHTPELPHFVVRIPDKELLENAEKGDLPKTLLLYDMAFNKGAKLKNIYHAMLNKQEYEKVMFLHDRYGGLDTIDNNALANLFLLGEESEQKELFNRFYCETFGKKDSCIWQKMCNYGILDKKIKAALENGIHPELPAIAEGRFKVSLRQLLYFVDEIRQPYQDIGIESNSDMFCNAAGIFIKWEKDNGFVE